MTTRGHGGRTDHLDHLQNDVSEVTSLLRQNVEKVIVRGDKIDDLQERSEDLESGSINFKKTSVRLKKKMCWQNCKMNCIIAIVAVVIVAIIVVIIVVEVKPGGSGGGGSHNNTLSLGD
ncbi:vesicle-associated membrane protein 4-like [Haliotis asinina]|uniref:vesicle-associated membrane protein 4-like n=1 Tax=Haliotis asinina TaxID=109174 RepID=UPI00353242A5